VGSQGHYLEGQVRVRISRVRVHRDHIAAAGRQVDTATGWRNPGWFASRYLAAGCTVLVLDRSTSGLDKFIKVEAYRCQSGS
jgi:hypothetical protein